MTKKIVILGGGLTGLSMARLLEPYDVEVEILERESVHGGLCRTKIVNGCAIDIGGGHIFNTNIPEVLDWVFALVPRRMWSKKNRNNGIFIDDKVISYPFELNLCHLKDGKQLLDSIINNSGNVEVVESISDYFQQVYGKYACDRYYDQYNKKVWRRPQDAGCSWMNPEKMPKSSIAKMINAFYSGGEQDKGMIHNTFFYPKTGGIQQALIDGIIKNSSLKIVKNYDIEKIYKGENYHSAILGKNDVRYADIVISTIPIGDLYSYLGINIDLDLRYTLTSVFTCKTNFFEGKQHLSWVYVPERNIPFHRIANTAYVQPSSEGIATIETTTPLDIEDTFNFGGCSFEILDKHTNGLSYPVEPLEGRNEIDSAVNLLEPNNIFSIGRWGKHQYWNMDLCIQDAMRTRNKLLSKGLIT